MAYKLSMKESAWVFNPAVASEAHPCVYDVHGYPSWEKPLIVEASQKGWHVLLRDEKKSLVWLGYHVGAKDALDALQRFADVPAR